MTHLNCSDGQLAAMEVTMRMRDAAEKFLTALTDAVKAAEGKEGSFNAEVALSDHFMGVRFTPEKGWEAIYQPSGSGFMTNPDWTGVIPPEVLAEAEANFG